MRLEMTASTKNGSFSRRTRQTILRVVVTFGCEPSALRKRPNGQNSSSNRIAGSTTKAGLHIRLAANRPSAQKYHRFNPVLIHCAYDARQSSAKNTLSKF